MTQLFLLSFWSVVFMGSFALEASQRIYTGAIAIKIGLFAVGAYAAWELEKLGITEVIALVCSGWVSI
jgi:hypothetical protein